MAVRTARKGDTVQYRDSNGRTQNAEVRGVAGAAPATPGSSTATTGGSLAATTTYGYKLTYIKDGVESAASAQKAQLTGAGGTNTVTITWAAVPGATGYKVYGRTNNGPWGLLSTLGAGATQYVDTGAATPGEAAPTTTDHVGLKGAHDYVERTRVAKATAMNQTGRYYLW